MGRDLNKEATLQITAVLVPPPAMLLLGMEVTRDEKRTTPADVAASVAEYVRVALETGVFAQGGTVNLTIQPIKPRTVQ